MHTPGLEDELLAITCLQCVPTWILMGGVNMSEVTGSDPVH